MAKKRKKKFNLNFLLSILAILVSVGTFLTFIYQTHLIQKQQYSAVLPYLELWNTEVDNRYALILTNNGIVPAFIENVSIAYEDSIYNLDPAQFVQEVLLLKDSLNFTYFKLKPGMTIPAGREVQVMVSDGSVQSNKRLRTIFNEEASVKISFSSLYDEKWEVDGIGNFPQKE